MARVVMKEAETIVIDKVDYRRTVVARMAETEDTEKRTSRPWLQLVPVNVFTPGNKEDVQERFQWAFINTLIGGFSNQNYISIRAAVEHMLKLTPEVHAFPSHEEAMQYIYGEPLITPSRREEPAPTPKAAEAPVAKATPVPGKPAGAVKTAPKHRKKRRKSGPKKGFKKAAPVAQPT